MLMSKSDANQVIKKVYDKVDRPVEIIIEKEVPDLTYINEINKEIKKLKTIIVVLSILIIVGIAL